MARYLLKRLLSAVVTIWVTTIAVVLLIHLVPGDPVKIMFAQSQSTTPEQLETVRHNLGLDRPIYEQYAIYMSRVLHGDFGHTIRGDQPILPLLLGRLPYTLALALSSLLVATVIGLGLGFLAAYKRGTALDSLCMVLAIGGVSVPVFWLGWMMLWLIAYEPSKLWNVDWFPIGGRISLRYDIPAHTHLMTIDALLAGNWPAFVDVLQHLALPAITLGTIPMAIIAKMTRAGMLEVMRTDYIRTARAKGLTSFAVVVRHGLRNALIPIVTVVGLQAGLLLGGAVLTESIFAWPGVGRLAFEAISNRDDPLINGSILLFATTFVIVNLIVDLLYAVLNPRIRYA